MKEQASNPSVHHIETSQQSSYFTSEKAKFFDSNKEAYHAAYCTLSAIYRLGGDQALQRFEECSTRTYLYFDPEECTVVARSNRCHNRWCPSCAAVRSKVVSSRCLAWLQRAHSPGLLTLTLSHQTSDCGTGDL